MEPIDRIELYGDDEPKKKSNGLKRAWEMGWITDNEYDRLQKEPRYERSSKGNK